MNRRVLFTAVAALALVAGAVPMGGLALTAAAQPAVPHANGTVLPSKSAPTPGRASTPVDAADSTPIGSSTPYVDPPLAERLRPLAPGDQLVTDQQLRDFEAEYRVARTASIAAEWVAEASIEVRCMFAAGFYWDPREASFAMTDPSQAVAPVGPAARLALDGNAGYPYHWQDAGCRGLAIHEAGSGD